MGTRTERYWVMMQKLTIAILCLVLASCAEFLENPEEIVDEIDDSLRPEHCLSLIRIDRTDVLDDQNIIFYMRGGKIYRNVLPHRCSGLRNRDAFMYRTTMNQLCDLDIITVLDQIGIGFTQGNSCGLSTFQPVTKDGVDYLKEQINRARALGVGDID